MNDIDIIRSWHFNAFPWIKAIQNEEIESRCLFTNEAIINALLKVAPTRVIDVGCGEGWFARQHTEKGIGVFGIDAIPTLIENAKKSCSAQFDVCTYEKLSSYPFDYLFDCAVCNFSLIGKESTEIVIRTLPTLLEKKW